MRSWPSSGTGPVSARANDGATAGPVPVWPPNPLAPLGIPRPPPVRQARWRPRSSSATRRSWNSCTQPASGSANCAAWTSMTSTRAAEPSGCSERAARSASCRSESRPTARSADGKLPAGPFWPAARRVPRYSWEPEVVALIHGRPGAWFMPGSRPPDRCRIPARTACGTRPPRTSSKAARTCAACRRCSATPRSLRRRSTPTSRLTGSSRPTAKRTRAPEDRARRERGRPRNRAGAADPAGCKLATGPGDLHAPAWSGDPNSRVCLPFGNASALPAERTSPVRGVTRGEVVRAPGQTDRAVACGQAHDTEGDTGMAPVVTMRQLLESGVHFGHQTRRWNPKMKRFIFTERNGIYIIDLQQSLLFIDRAYEFIKETVAHGGSVLYVGTKKQAQEEIDFDDVSGSNMTKKELLQLRRERDKLERSLGGIRDMSRVPSAIWVVDTKKEHIAVSEARKLGIPVIAILDTNCDPDEVTYPIPGNDDAIRSVALLTRVVADAVADGLIARAGANAGEEKPSADLAPGDLGTEEPLPEWERELLVRNPAENGTAVASAAEPGAAHLVGAADVAGIESATAEPATAEPATAEPATAEPATAEPGSVTPGDTAASDTASALVAEASEEQSEEQAADADGASGAASLEDAGETAEAG